MPVKAEDTALLEKAKLKTETFKGGTSDCLGVQPATKDRNLHRQSSQVAKRHLLNWRPKRMTDATVERTMAAAAENPFMMLSVYFTTTDV